MRVEISTPYLKEIMETCGTLTKKDDSIFSNIQLSFDAASDVCTAYATNGSALIRMTAPCACEADGVLHTPVIKVPALKHIYTTISVSDAEIEFDFGISKTSVKKPTGKFPPQVERPFSMQPAPSLQIDFNPKLLADALKCFGSEKAVKLSFSDKNSGCIIESETKKALVLPLLQR